MAIAGDVANFLLGGIPGEVHDLFVADVEPGDLIRASTAMTDAGDTVGTVHLRLADSVTSLEGRWQGEGAAAFESEIWQPLSAGLGVLERECHTAASQLIQLAAQAEQAHLWKIAAIEQAMHEQLNVMAITWVVATPEVGGLIAEAVGNVAARLGGELVGRIVAGIVDAIEQVLQKVLAAFARLFEWVARPIAGSIADIGGEFGKIFGISLRGHVSRSSGLLLPDVAPADAAAVTAAITLLRKGSSSGIYTVSSDAELQSLYDELSADGSLVSNSYRGEMVRLPDGTTVGIRQTSRSGGPAIDVKLPSGSLLKVHVSS